MVTDKTNIIYCMDCLEGLKKIKDNSIDLIYLDPPFFSNKNYEGFWLNDKRFKLSFKDMDWGKIEIELEKDDLKEYEEISKRWKKGMLVYVTYLRKRLEQCHRVLKSSGAIFLHLDWHIVHYIKIEMDKIFGYNNFRNEIIWHYGQRMMHINTALNRKHDTILFYAKSKQTKITMPTTPWTIETYENCRRKKVKFDKDNKPYIIETSDPRNKKKIFYIEETIKMGKAMDDVWDIPFVNPTSKEKLGYPTQKPEKLLERIIFMGSKEGDIILDPFCGCGTSISVAFRLKRKFIGMDISKKAIKVMTDRMKNNFGLDVEVIGGENIEILKNMNPHLMAERLIEYYLSGTINPKKTGDMGIDGWINQRDIPVQVKRWGNKVGRPELDKFLSAIRREKKNTGMIIAFDFSKNCYQEAARIKLEENINIELKRIEDIIKNDKSI